MAIKPSAAVAQAKEMFELQSSERRKLDAVRRYWRGRQALPAAIKAGSPHEVKVMAASSRVNMMPIVVNSLVQSAFVEGFRDPDGEIDHEIWKVWQANRMDARQTAIHRAAAAYNAAYVVVLPGDPYPVTRPVSPRNITTLYGGDPDWPMWALERASKNLFKLYDETSEYWIQGGEKPWLFLEGREHGLGFTPVVRFVDEHDLDADDEPSNEMTAATRNRHSDLPVGGQIAPLAPLQDQIDLATFGLQVAQHFGAFRQRYIIGWVGEDEKSLLKMGASQLWTIDEDPSNVSIGDLNTTDLKGYIESRESSLRHAAALSQTPAHELIGMLINMSAEALAAAEAGKERKVEERTTNWGESHEQVFWAAGQYMGIDVALDSQVVWRDTSARAFSATVDALGKLSQMLGVPPQELWERIPGVTQSDVRRWKDVASSGDSFDKLTQMLGQQSATATPATADS